MTNQEFSDEFDVLYNNIMSNQAPGLDEYEKSVFLTKAQDEIIKAYFNPSYNKSQDGFDDNQKRQIDFSNLIKVYTTSNPTSITVSLYSIEGKWSAQKFTGGSAILVDVSVILNSLEEGKTTTISCDYLSKSTGAVGLPLTILPTSGTSIIAVKLGDELYLKNVVVANSITPLETRLRFDKRSTVVELPTDIMMVINETVYVTRDNRTVPLTVLPISYSEYTRVMSKPFKRPTKNNAWRLLNSNNSVQSELILGANDTFNEYLVRFIKRPHAIILEDLEGVTIEGQSSKQECELDPEIHHEILQRAVELAKAAYTGDLTSQIVLGQSSATEKGIVAQGR